MKQTLLIALLIAVNAWGLADMNQKSQTTPCGTISWTILKVRSRGHQVLIHGEKRPGVYAKSGNHFLAVTSDLYNADESKVLVVKSGIRLSTLQGQDIAPLLVSNDYLRPGETGIESTTSFSPGQHRFTLLYEVPLSESHWVLKAPVCNGESLSVPLPVLLKNIN